MFYTYLQLISRSFIVFEPEMGLWHQFYSGSTTYHYTSHVGSMSNPLTFKAADTMLQQTLSSTYSWLWNGYGLVSLSWVSSEGDPLERKMREFKEV